MRLLAPCLPAPSFCLQICYTVFQFTYIFRLAFAVCFVGEFSANVPPDVEAMAAAALSGMGMGSGPGFEGYEGADNDKHNKEHNMESGKSGENNSLKLDCFIRNHQTSQHYI